MLRRLAAAAGGAALGTAFLTLPMQQKASARMSFQVVAGSQPTLPVQSLQPGMMYVDSDGYWWIWQKDQTNVYDWHKIKAV